MRFRRYFGGKSTPCRQSETTWIQGVNEKCLNLKDKENVILRNWILEKRNLIGGRRTGVCEINFGRVAFEKPAW